MEIQIIEENKNPTLGRKELKIKITHDSITPKRSDVKNKMIALANAKKETLIVDTFKSKFGSRESTGLVKVYDNREKLLEMEKEHMLLKNFSAEELESLKKGESLSAKKEAPKKEEKAAEAKEEAPAKGAKEAEEKKEAPAEESKEKNEGE